jgi:hypothetical protein
LVDFAGFAKVGLLKKTVRILENRSVNLKWNHARDPVVEVARLSAALTLVSETLIEFGDDKNVRARISLSR